MPKKKITLKKSAVPSIFPNCPGYLTDGVLKPQTVLERKGGEDRARSLTEEPD